VEAGEGRRIHDHVGCNNGKASLILRHNLKSPLIFMIMPLSVQVCSAYVSCACVRVFQAIRTRITIRGRVSVPSAARKQAVRSSTTRLGVGTLTSNAVWVAPSKDHVVVGISEGGALMWGKSVDDCMGPVQDTLKQDPDYYNTPSVRVLFQVLFLVALRWRWLLMMSLL
jgi:hypothetical protein